MRALKFLIYGFGLLFLLMVVVGVFMPRRWEARAERTLAVAPERLQAILEDPVRWGAWMPWSKEKDPSLVISYAGPLRGKGAQLTFAGDLLGSGSLTIVETRPLGGIDYELRFQGVEQGTRGSLQLTPQGAGAGATSQLVWIDGGELGFDPIPRLFAGLFEAKLRQDFQQAMARLEAAAELQLLAEAVDAWSAAHGGQPPASLAELRAADPASATVWTDPWGAEYRYEPAAGAKPRLWSLGRDAAPGGKGENADLEHEWR